MTTVKIIAVFLGVWNLIGVIIISSIGGSSSCSEGALGRAKGFEFVNPLFIYKHNRVNWFGAIVVCLIYSFICPIATILYWLYKLCTAGRK